MLLTPRPLTDFPPYDQRLMDELMRKAFAQRRKQIKKQLPSSPPWQQVAAEMGIKETARPEELDLAQWIELTNHYDSHPLKGIAQKDHEIFDVVDASDQVTGQATRKEVHEQGLMHRAVHILVRNKHGHFLLQKRSPWKDRQPGIWDSSASGHLDSGESYEQAGIRELKEELSVSADRLVPLTRIQASAETGWEHVEVFMADHTGKVRFPAAEIEAVHWFTPDQIEHWMTRRPEDFSRTLIKAWNVWYNLNNKQEK